MIKEDDNTLQQTCSQCYTSLDSDMFLTKEFYVGLDGVLNIFDTGCYISVTPHTNQQHGLLFAGGDVGRRVKEGVVGI